MLTTVDLSLINKAFGGLKVESKHVASDLHPLRIGFHTNKDKFPGFIQPLEADHQALLDYFSYTAAQIFTQVPQTTAFMKMEEPVKIVDFLKENDMKIVIHTPYAMNSFWRSANADGTPDITKLSESLDNAKKFMYDSDGKLIHQLVGLVVHLPKMVPENVVHVIKHRSANEVTILLENHAYKPDEGSYETPVKLNKLTDLLIKANVQNWGYCIDTAHLFVQISKADRAVGYTVETRAGMEKWLSELSSETRSRIKCWHLNGSMNPASSYDDKHAIPIFGLNFKSESIPNPTGKLKAAELEKGYCRDYMWGDLLMKEEIIKDGVDFWIRDQLEALSDSSLIPVLKHSMTHKIPIILEINRGNNDDIKACLTVFSALEKDILDGKFD